MINRFALPTVALMAGLMLAAAVPSIPQTVRRYAGMPVSPAEASSAPAATPKAEGKAAEAEDAHGEEGKIAMTAEQVTARPGR